MRCMRQEGPGGRVSHALHETGGGVLAWLGVMLYNEGISSAAGFMKPLTQTLLLLGMAGALYSAPIQADEPNKTLFFFVQGNPAGLALQYDLELPLRGPFLVGLNYADYVYTGAAELSLRYRYLGGLVDVLAGVGAEGGTYYQLQPGQALTAYADLAPREFGIKRFARSEAKLNLKLDKVWLYGRLSPTYRARDYVELDTRRATVLQNEFSMGSAAALIVRAWGTPSDAVAGDWNREGWVYVEYTRETVTRYASDDALVADGKDLAISRPSAGIIGYAPFDWERVSYDLDLYYSLVDRNLFPETPYLGLKGFGAQLFVWVNY